MGTQTVRTCDVYGLRKGVEAYSIAIDKVAGGEEVFGRILDLSPKALERLTRWIERACSPPKAKA